MMVLIKLGIVYHKSLFENLEKLAMTYPAKGWNVSQTSYLLQHPLLSAILPWNGPWLGPWSDP